MAKGNGQYRVVKLTPIQDFDSIRKIEDMFNLQSKYYSNVGQYAVYRQDKQGRWVAWLDPVDIANLIDGKINIEFDDDLIFEDEDE